MYYAVRKGKKPGIYDNWEETRQNTQGFPGCEFRKFKHLPDAVAYMAEGKHDQMRHNMILKDPHALRLTVDGSFNDETGEIGWAYIVTRGASDRILISDSGAYSTEEDRQARNIAGEITAVLHGVRAVMDRFRPLYLVVQYDYNGLEYWITGQWKAKNPLAIRYREELAPLYESGIITFQHIEAHKHWANKIVDGLAKQACGIIECI